MENQTNQSSSLHSLRHLLLGRPTGCTSTERNLTFLTSQAFFALWCYPNLYKAKGKELCDLMIVFGDDIVLFSDKNISYSQHTDQSVAWRRWYSKAVLASVNQLFGAESSIRRFPSNIFLDSACTIGFPLLPLDLSRIRFHRVAIANGSREACKSFTKSRFGSLKISSKLEGNALLDNHFNIGRIDANKPFVHVFDSVSLAVVLGELDTMKDFIDYLSQKESLFETGRRIDLAGEEQLLSHYLEQGNKFGDADDLESADEEQFSRLVRSKAHIEQKQANEVSYLFDTFIEQTIWRGEQPAFLAKYDLKFDLFEKAVRAIAQESRLKRRSLGQAFFSLKATKWDRPTARCVWVKEEPDNLYVFTVEPNQPVVGKHKPQGFLYVSCFLAPSVAPEAKRVIGVDVGAVGPSSKGALFYMDMTDPNIASMVNKFQADYPASGRMRKTEQKVGRDTRFKEPGGPAARRNGWNPMKP